MTEPQKKKNRKPPVRERTRPVDIERAEDRLKAVELRKRGASYDQIGKAIGVTKVTAFRYVKQYLAELRESVLDSQQDLILLEMQRLDAMFMEAFSQVKKAGDLKAIDACLKVMERRAKLLGIDAATMIKTISINLPDVQGLSDDELDALRKSFSRD